jgi:hypothetical protein
MRTPNRRLTTLLAVALLGGPSAVHAAPAPGKYRPSAEDVARAERAVTARLEELKGSAAVVQPIRDDTLDRTFPGSLFFAAFFRQYPVARLTPEGLKDSNLCAVGRGGKVELMTDSSQLKQFFKDHLPPARTADQFKDAARAWLRLTQALHQDGFYQFAIEEDSLKVNAEKDGTVVTGKAVVTRGGNGEIRTHLTFRDGRLALLNQDTRLRSGPRPICQATKLLDPDPVVRRMAEQDLLIMGRAARGYLDDQRARASPDLQRAIDRLWQRICAEDR